jgi:hypothetical protein
MPDAPELPESPLDLGPAPRPPGTPKGRGHRRAPLTEKERLENAAGRELLGSYGAHLTHLRESASSANVGTDMRAGAAEVAERNRQLEFIKESGTNRYVEEGTEGQFQESSDLTGGRFGRLAGSSGSGMVREVFSGTPSSMSGFTAPLSGSSHNPPPPSQTVSGSESYPAFKPLPPGAIRPPNK